MAEKRSNAKGAKGAKGAKAGRTGRTAAASKRSRGSTARGGESDRATASRSSNGGRKLTARDAVKAARSELAALLGRPVDSVLGVDREQRNWVVTAQVVELERIPSTTDVLGEYEAILDGTGELVSYKRTRRYHRGHTDGGQS